MGLAREPFPPLLRWALLAPFGVFFSAWVAAVLGKDAAESKILNGVLVVATGAAALVEVIAIPVALFLLVRDAPRYVTLGTVAMTLAAALPVAILAVVVLALFGVFGTFHI